MTSVKAEVGAGPRRMGGVTWGGVWSVLGGWSRTVKWRILIGTWWIPSGWDPERAQPRRRVFWPDSGPVFWQEARVSGTAEVNLLG